MYNDDYKLGNYAAEFRKEARKTEQKPGQNIVSHTSIHEHGRNSAGVKRIAEFYDELETPKAPK